MEITKGYAQQLLRQNKAIIMRFQDDGTRLSDVTAWGKGTDGTWSSTRNTNGGLYAIIDRLDIQRTDHVEIV